jgi:hypothetical protein
MTIQTARVSQAGIVEGKGFLAGSHSAINPKARQSGVIGLFK